MLVMKVRFKILSTVDDDDANFNINANMKLVKRGHTADKVLSVSV